MRLPTPHPRLLLRGALAAAIAGLAAATIAHGTSLLYRLSMVAVAVQLGAYAVVLTVAAMQSRRADSAAPAAPEMSAAARASMAALAASRAAYRLHVPGQRSAPADLPEQAVRERSVS